MCIALKPDNHNIELLESNIKLNNFTERTEVKRCAISDTDGTIDFWIAKHPNLNSVKKTKHSIRKEEVPCYTLGTYLKDRKYPNFIKMDVEGHEVKIFEGALEYFTENRGRTNFLVEVHPHFYDEENDFEAILKEYFKIGFNCKYVIATPIPQPSLFKEYGYAPVEVVYTDGWYRGIYNDIDNEDMLEFACKEHHEAGSKKNCKKFYVGERHIRWVCLKSCRFFVATHIVRASSNPYIENKMIAETILQSHKSLNLKDVQYYVYPDANFKRTHPELMEKYFNYLDDMNQSEELIRY